MSLFSVIIDSTAAAIKTAGSMDVGTLVIAIVVVAAIGFVAAQALGLKVEIKK